MITLTNKERMQLEDEKNLEDLCVKKYTSFANQANDQALTEMFNRHAVDEQRHYDIINGMLQGQDPPMAQQQNQQQNASGQQGMQQNAGQNQAQQNTPQQPLANSQPQTMGQAMSSQDDCTLCTDMLATEKHISSTYDTAVFESAQPIVRQTLQKIQQDEQRHGEEIFNYMNSHGMYNLS